MVCVCVCVRAALCLRSDFFPCYSVFFRERKNHNHHHRSFIFGSICLSNFVCNLRERSTSVKATRRWRTRHTVWLCVIQKSHSNLRTVANNNRLAWFDSNVSSEQKKLYMLGSFCTFQCRVFCCQKYEPSIDASHFTNMTTSDMHKLSVTFQAKINTWNMQRNTTKMWKPVHFVLLGHWAAWRDDGKTAFTTTH